MAKKTAAAKPKTGRNRGASNAKPKPAKTTEPFQEDAKYEAPLAKFSTTIRMGPPPIYVEGPKGAEQLWNDCRDYFHSRDAVAITGKFNAIPPPYTLTGLCLFLGISHETWCQWRTNRDDLSEVITRAQAVIYDQKFTGAAVGSYSSNIIARDLGLTDKKEITHDGQLESLTDEQLQKRLTSLVADLGLTPTSAPGDDQDNGGSED